MTQILTYVSANPDEQVTERLGSYTLLIEEVEMRMTSEGVLGARVNLLT